MKALVLLLFMLPAAKAALAQDRQLSWPSFAVNAHLDGSGRLHVRERQMMRFTGDWNGGERRFDVRFGQSFRFDSIVRVDSETGTQHRLKEDDLSDVDEFKWFDNRTLRWRSRLPADPVFDNTTLVYELAFSYADIVDRTDSGYLLDHDFAFPDRSADIENFELTLTLDSAWRPPAGFSGKYSARVIPRGDRFVVTVILTRAVGAPAVDARALAPVWFRAGVLGMLALVVAVLAARWYAHDRASGRFAEAITPDEITPEWLQQEVYVHLPEVIGTAWDNETSHAEVAATLSRLVQEKKLGSRVEAPTGIFGTHNLHLELQVPRSQLVGHERELIDALFESGATSTSTEEVRKRYKKSGFDPARVIRKALKLEAAKLAPAKRNKAKKQERAFTLAVVVSAAVLLIAGAVKQPSDGPASLAVIGASIPAYGFAMLIATDLRNRVSGYWFTAGVTLGIVIAITIAFAFVVLGGRPYKFGMLTTAGLAMWVVALFNSIRNHARLALSPARVALRKRLYAARVYFQRELAKEAPNMTDAVYPYLLAFGLGPHVDKWFRAFGGENPARSNPVVAGAGRSASASGSSGGSFTGFGGGGAFSGGGGGSSFGAAIGGMASSIAAPSSSSSGGGRSGGGSSGGGGGGGW